MTNTTNSAASRGFTWQRFVLPVLSMAAVVLLSNILVQYPIGEWLTWGAFSYPLTYFVTDVCNRWAGPPLARRVAWAGFVTGVACSLIVAWPHIVGATVPLYKVLEVRIAVASGAAFLVSQLLDIAVFNQLRKKSWWKAPLWGSSAASVIDTAIFFSVAFAGTHLPWLQLGAGDLCVKLTMALVLLVPFRVLIASMGLMPKKAA